MRALLTKSKILTISGIITLLLLIANYVGNVSLCTWKSIEYYSCLDTLWLVEIVFSPLIPTFLLSVLTYSIREKIFDTWIAFAKWWIPLSMLLILLVPEELSGAISVPLKVPVALFCSGLFFLISLIIIFWKRASLKKYTK